MRGWIIGGLTAVVMAWLLFTTALLSTPATESFRGPEARFVPDSGQAERWLLGGDPGVAASVEHALFTRMGLVDELPFPVIQKIRPPAGVPTADYRWWRETVSPNAPHLDPRHTLRGVTPAGVGLYARTGPDGVTLVPALLELPSDVAAGHTWESDGQAEDAQGQTGYRNSSRAEAAPTVALREAGCLQVTSTTTIRELARTDVAVWCPDKGIVAGTPTLGEPVRIIDRGQWPWAARVQTQPTWPTRGVSEPARLVSGDPTFGLSTHPASFDRRIAPVVTPAGTMFSVGNVGSLQGWIRRDDALVLVWWADPGGSILSLTALDNIVLVTTSERRIVAYDQNGRRLWSNRTQDLVNGGAVGIGRDQFALASVTGDLEIFNVSDGDRMRRTEFPSGTDVAPIPVGPDLIVAGRDRAITAFDTGGAEVWRTDELSFDPIGMAYTAEKLLVMGGGGQTYTIDRGSGEVAKGEVVAYGKGHQLLTGGPGVAALRSGDGVRLLDPSSGRVVVHIPGASTVVATADGWRVLAPEALIEYASDGTERGRVVLDRAMTGALNLTPAEGLLWVVTGDEVTWVR